MFNFIKNKLEQNNISDIKLIFDEDQKQLYIDTLKARIWVDIYNIETTLSDLKDTVLGESLILSYFPGKMKMMFYIVICMMLVQKVEIPKQ